MALNFEHIKKPDTQGQGAGKPGTPESIPPIGHPSSEIPPETLKALGISHESELPKAIKKGIEEGWLIDTTKPPHSPED